MAQTFNPDHPHALSVKQPWAWLITHGYKDIENRTWATKYRGPFLIHASLKFDSEGYDWVRSNFQEIPMPLPEDFERGGLVGVATLINVFIPGSPVASPWYAGQYGYEVCDARPLPFRACRGMLKFFIPD